jgi:hypothetical protein
VRIVELVGLPGSGKSTIHNTLLSRGDGVVPMPILRYRPHAGVLARHVAATLATLARHGALRPPPSREWLMMLTYVRALPPVLRGPNRPPGDLLVFNQGPIFTLSRPSARDERLAGWWDRSVDIWRSLFDAVIWLDAPDPVLLERIDSREEPHRLKGSPRPRALESLAQDRAVYESVLDRFAGGPPILRFDTSRRSADEIADDVLATISTS